MFFLPFCMSVSLLGHFHSTKILLLVQVYRLKKSFSRAPRLFSGKEPACQCGRHGLDLWSVRVLCASKQLGPPNTTPGLVLWAREPHALQGPRPWLHDGRRPRRKLAHCSETAHCQGERLCSPQQRKTPTRQHGPATPNRINLKNFLSVLLFCKHTYLALIFEGFFTKELIWSIISELL